MDSQIRQAFETGIEYHKMFESVNLRLNILRSEYDSKKIKNKKSWLNRLEKVRKDYRQLTAIISKYPIEYHMDKVKETNEKIKDLENKIN
jgi:hypothetical protein